MSRPLPRPTAETRPFWDGCNDGVLRFQGCARCGQIQLIPRTCCAGCHQGTLEWKTSTGRGRILSHTTVYRAPTAAFRDEVPYVIAIIEMDEGFRLMVNVKDGTTVPLGIDHPVRITFGSVEGVQLPQAEVIA